MKRFMSISFVLLLCCSIILPSASVNGAKKKAKLSKTSTSLYVGKSVTLKVKNNKKKVKWSSSDKTIAKVSSKGKVTGLKEGKAKITAKVKKKKYVCKVTVKEKEEKIVYNNSVFTEELYNSIKSVSFFPQSGSKLTSKAEISKMYKLVAGLSKLTAYAGEWEPPKGIIGRLYIVITFKDGTNKKLDYYDDAKIVNFGGNLYTLENETDIQNMGKVKNCVSESLEKLH